MLLKVASPKPKYHPYRSEVILIRFSKRQRESLIKTLAIQLGERKRRIGKNIGEKNSTGTCQLRVLSILLYYTILYYIILYYIVLL